MTPKEKAEEMYRTYIDYTHGHFNCKQCALIAVDEMIELCESYVAPYYYEVKKEIEKL